MVKITNVGVIEKEIAMTLVFLNMQIKTLCLYKIEKAYEKHVAEFSDFEKAYESIPEIIRDADYVGLHPNGDSLQYIKRLMAMFMFWLLLVWVLKKVVLGLCILLQKIN